MTADYSRRDLNLIRQIMLDLESGDKGDYSDYESAQVLYNKWLLLDAGMAIGGETPSDDHLFRVTLIRLTWKGCEFLDLAREDSTWKTAVTRVADTAGSVSLKVLTAVLIQIATTKIGLV